MTEPERMRVAIIGTGFSGLAMAIPLQKPGRGDFLLLERSDAIGGTWRDNHCPGCACRSWYLDRDGVNTTLWPGSTAEFLLRTWRFDPSAHVMTRVDHGAIGCGIGSQTSPIPSSSLSC